MAVLLTSVYVALAALNLCENFISVNLKRAIGLKFGDLVSLNLVLDHHLDDLFRVIDDLLKSHVHLNFFKHLGLIVDLLDVL